MRTLLFLLVWLGLTGCNRVYRDADEDSFGDPDVWIMSNSSVSGYVNNKADCDDTRAFVNPDAVEIPGNGLDDDCDGVIDSATGDTGDTGPDTGVESGDTSTADSGSPPDTAAPDTGAGDTATSDSGTDTSTADTSDTGDTSSPCASGESIVHIEFDAPGGSTGLYVWGEVWSDTDTKTGLNIIPQGTWATDWVPGLSVSIVGTHAEVDYSECVADSATWFMTFAFLDASGNELWSCYGIDSSSTILYGNLLFLEDSTVNLGDVYYKSGTEGSGCERIY